MIDLALALFSTARGAPPSYAQSAPIVTTIDAPFQEFTIPVGAYLSAEFADLRDLRVVNASGAEVPYAFVPSTSREEVVTVPFFDLWESDDDVLVTRDQAGAVSGVLANSESEHVVGYLVDVGVAPAATVALDLALTNPNVGYQRVKVEASEDLSSWTTVASDAGIVRLKVDGKELRRERIEFRASRARYLRVLWNWTDSAAALSGIRVSRRAGADDEPELVWTPPVAATRTPEGDDVLVLPHTLRAERLHVDLAGRNVLAPVALATWSQPGEAWHDRAHALVYRLDAQDRDWTSDDLSLPAPVRGVRLHPDQASLGDAPPTFTLGLRPDRVIFVASGAGPYTLTIGNPDARPVALAPAALVPGLGSERAPPIALATVTLDVPLTPSAEPAAGSIAAAPRAWTLWGVLLAGVAILVAMAASLLRRTRS